MVEIRDPFDPEIRRSTSSSADDLLEIGQLMSLYAFAIDAKQWHLFDRIFTEDVVADYPGRRWESLESWRTDFDRSHQQYEVTQHLVSNLYCEVTGTRARATSQVHFQLIRESDSYRDRVCGGAWYGDALRRTDRGWRIAMRICRITWRGGNLDSVDSAAAHSEITPMSKAVEAGWLPSFAEDHWGPARAHADLFASDFEEEV